MPLLKLELADQSELDGCTQIRRRASKEETIRRSPLPSTSPMLGGKKKSLSEPFNEAPRDLALYLQERASEHFFCGTKPCLAIHSLNIAESASI